MRWHNRRERASLVPFLLIPRLNMTAVDARTQPFDEVSSRPIQPRGNLAAELESLEQRHEQEAAAAIQAQALAPSKPANFRQIKREAFRRLLECQAQISEDELLKSQVWRHLDSLPSKYIRSIEPERWDVIREHMNLLNDAEKISDGLATFSLRRIEVVTDSLG